MNLAGIPCPSRQSLLGEDEIEAAKARKKTARWSPSTIESILTNKKYKSDAILQKTYCTDYIKKTFVVNDGGEIPKYYAQNSHQAIVSAGVLDLTQMELEWRRSLKGSYSGKKAVLLRASSVVTAVPSMAVKSGTARMHTGVRSGAATINTRVKRGVRHRM